ncbi:IS1182 family transposase [Nonomuraea wenchangensis]|uniref:Transposase domain n=2 Tax=Nonomuraea wenchangensis TaxID=568860 RepID=A0A1I0LX14_9ACTN|nr:IS1182 family transposase [Nonomuraea wenchangensis]SEU48261.1 Transposase domain [Nonomuraea wenchangensis]
MMGHRPARPVGPDVWSTCRELIPAGSVYAFLAEHRDELFPEEMFADLYAATDGRPSIPPQELACVLVLQALLHHSDPEAALALRCDLRWKAACGLGLHDRGFDPSLLVYFRQRLRRSGDPNRIFARVSQVAAASGVLSGRTRRVLDSVVLEDAVATQDTITQLIAAIRRAGRQVPGAAQVITERCHATDYGQAGKPAIAWDDATARQELVSALVTDALAVVAAFETAARAGKLDEAAGQALALLALVAGQDVEPAEGSDGTDGRWRIARKVAPDRIISTVDPQTRHVHKTVQHRQDGYKGHVVIEPDTGLFTGVRLTMASGAGNHEAEVGVDLLTGEPAGPATFEVLGDSAYGTGDARAALADAGHTAVIKPAPLRPAVAGGFTIGDFHVDEVAGTVTCPAGVQRHITPARHVVFGAACSTCPLRQRCTTSKDGRTLRLHPHDALLRQARHVWATDPRLRAAYRQHRPMVERSIAWLIGADGGARKLRYRGVGRNNLWLNLRAAALNMRRLINLGLTHVQGDWTLRPATG